MCCKIKWPVSVSVFGKRINHKLKDRTFATQGIQWISLRLLPVKGQFFFSWWGRFGLRESQNEMF